MQLLDAEVGIANFFSSPLIANPLIANPLIFFLNPLNANLLIFTIFMSANRESANILEVG
jgi:hypothetical protein